MTKNDIRIETFKFLSTYGKNIRTKLNNICGKTGQYYVPYELYSKRTSRSNRVLLPWKTIKNNNLNIEQLKTFYGGVVVEFVNEDYFLEQNNSNPVFLELKNKIGSDDIISSMISIRTENGNSSSQVQRKYFIQLLQDTIVNYNGQKIIINEHNYKNYVIRRKNNRIKGKGNEYWDGFLYISIKGGQQDTIESHEGI